MDWQLIFNAIGSIGFPIVGCCALAYFCVQITNNYRNDLKEQNSMHKEETAKLVDAVNNNSLVIQRLIDKLDAEK